VEAETMTSLSRQRRERREAVLARRRRRDINRRKKDEESPIERLRLRAFKALKSKIRDALNT
jgi:hypothetical protein